MWTTFFYLYYLLPFSICLLPKNTIFLKSVLFCQLSLPIFQPCGSWLAGVAHVAKLMYVVEHLSSRWCLNCNFFASLSNQTDSTTLNVWKSLASSPRGICLTGDNRVPSTNVVTRSQSFRVAPGNCSETPTTSSSPGSCKSGQKCAEPEALADVGCGIEFPMMHSTPKW